MSLITYVKAYTDEYCGDGRYCYGTTVVDVFFGCNVFYTSTGDKYCTQKYMQPNPQEVSCNSECQYLRWGLQCFSDCTTSVYWHSGGCCVSGSPCTNTCACPSGYSTTKPLGEYITTSETGKKSDCSNCGGTCYKACPLPTCTSYSDESGASWEDLCSSRDCREADLNVPIPDAPSGCSTSKPKTCYNTDNEKPTLTSINIVPYANISGVDAYSTDNIFMKLVNKVRAASFSDDTILGYFSEDHSGIGTDYQGGGGVNNPLGLEATYSDTDGQDDIQAIYVWWNKSDTKNFNTPDQVTTADKQTESEESFGFMISRDSIGGTWDKVYIPGEGNVFTQAGTIGEAITILGPDPDNNNMIELNNISVVDQGTNEIHLELTMKFFTNTGDTVDTHQYNLWGMANDYIGFTNLTGGEDILEPNEWTDSGEDWTLDMQIPNIDTFNSPVDIDKSLIKINIEVRDDDSLQNVRLDACKSGIDDPSPLNESYILESCNDFLPSELDMTDGSGLLGSPSISGGNYSTSIEIDLGENQEGAINFYLTVMDKAGNVAVDTRLYKLEQWAYVKDGFVFGKNGVTSSTRAVEANKWDGVNFLDQFEETQVDLTNQVLLGAKSLSSIFLRDLVHAGEGGYKQFLAANYPGLFLGLPYQELKIAYKNKKDINGITPITLSSSTLTGDLPSGCVGSYCILERAGNLTIDNFTCNGNALIAVEGNVTIQPNLLDDSDEDVCIVLASGNIEIGVGDTGTETPSYDRVHAFLIAGGQIHAVYDDEGLFVEGGLISFTPSEGGNRSSVYNEREIDAEYMGLYPVLIVDNNSKYGLLSKTVFGSQIDVFKTEVGLKPY